MPYHRGQQKPYWNNYAEVTEGGITEGGESTPGVSKYNSGMLTNQRLHNLWVACQSHWRKGEIDKMNDCLDLVWVELYADAVPLHQEAITKFNKDILTYTENLRVIRNPKEIRSVKSNLAITVYNKLLFLKKVEKKQGRGLAYKDEFEDDFD